MAIQETTKKIHLLPYQPRRGRAKNQDDTPTVNVSIEKERIQFSRYAVEQMQMVGKFVRFYYDPVKKIIAWKVEDRVEQQEMKLWRVCRVYKNGVWSFSIKKMIDLFQLGKKGLKSEYRNVPIQKYREVDVMSRPNDTYFFITLAPEYALKEEL